MQRQATYYTDESREYEPHAHIRQGRYNIVYNSESNQWTAEEADGVLPREIIESNLELLGASARNSSTPIRPYFHSRMRARRTGEMSHQQRGHTITYYPHEIGYRVEDEEAYDIMVRDSRRRHPTLLRNIDYDIAHIQEDHEAYQHHLDQEDELSEIRSPQAKSIEDYSQIIPACWSELLEKDNAIAVYILESYGPFSLLLYNRILKLSKDYIDMRELRIIAVISAAQATGRRHGLDEIKFIQKILEFYNFNVSLAKRDPKSKMRLQLLLSVIPSFKELMQAYKECPPQDNEIIVYKVVLDIMERYYLEFESPLYKKYKKQLVPFAQRFYKDLNKKSLELITTYVNYMKPYYSKFLFFESKVEYLEYYDKKIMDFDNLCKGTRQKDCLL